MTTLFGQKVIFAPSSPQSDQLYIGLPEILFLFLCALALTLMIVAVIGGLTVCLSRRRGGRHAQTTRRPRKRRGYVDEDGMEDIPLD